MPTQPSSLMPTQTNPPRQPLLPVKKIYGIELATVSQLLRPANLMNRGIRIENRMDVDVFMSVTGNPATDSNIRIRAGDDFDWPVGMTQAIWIIAPGAKKDSVIVYHEFV